MEYLQDRNWTDKIFHKIGKSVIERELDCAYVRDGSKHEDDNLKIDYWFQGSDGEPISVQNRNNRWQNSKYNSFTLRYLRNTHEVEYRDIIADVFAFFYVNASETGFVKYILIDRKQFQEFLREKTLEKLIKTWCVRHIFNKDNTTSFLSFDVIKLCKYYPAFRNCIICSKNYGV